MHSVFHSVLSFFQIVFLLLQNETRQKAISYEKENFHQLEVVFRYRDPQLKMLSQ